MKTLLRITAYGLRRRRLFIGTAVVRVVAVLPQVVVPLLLGTAIDEALSSGLLSRLLLLAAIILLMALLRGALFYSSLYLAEASALQVSYDLRKEFFHKLQNLSLGFYDRQQTGNLMSRATVDVRAMGEYVGIGLLGGLGNVMTFVIAVAIMMVIDLPLGLMTMAFIAVLIWISATFMLRVIPLFSIAHEETGRMNSVVQENLAGVRVVKAFGAMDHEKAKFQDRARAVATHFYEVEKVFVVRQAVTILVFAAASAAILLFGGRDVFSGRLTPGELATFVLYMGLLNTPVWHLGWRVQMFARAIAAGRRVFEVLDAESPVEEKPRARRMDRVEGHVRFENVSLSYGGSTEALHNVDFEVQPGQTVAILGGPGSGKSTVVHILPRFYDASSGRVLIDGADVRDVTLNSLRKNVGIVHQDVFAFSATIKDNIAYGANGTTLEDVISAAGVANLSGFIEGLPDGYDTWVGERGVTLSGGQRQRLAIARTILTDPPILILDDSMSSVDAGTESLIQKALAEAAKGRTTFVIAHRLSTVRDADLIVVLDRGKVVERGSHDELLRGDGFYRRIYDLQIRPQEESRRLKSQLSSEEERHNVQPP